MRREWPWVAVALLVVALPHLSVLAGRSVYAHDDLGLASLPMRSFAAAELARGNLTPWCWLVGCGFPFWASAENGTFYAPNLAFLADLPVGLVMGWLMWAHYVLSAVGVYLLARRLGCSELGAALSAGVFNLGGFMIAHLVHFPMLCAAAWLPWVWYGVVRWRQTADWPAPALVAFASCMQLLAGVPQVWLISLASSLVLATVFTALGSPTGFRAARSFDAAALTTAAGIIGAGGAAAQIIPMAVLVSRSLRASSCHEFVTELSLGPRVLRSFVDAHAAYALGWEFCAFLGGGALALALIGAIRRGWRPADWALWAIVVVTLAMGLSEWNPIYRLIWRVPLLGAMRCWCRWLLPCCAALAVLAGLGLTHLERRSFGTSLRSARLALALALTAYYAQWHLFTIPGNILVNWEWLADRIPGGLTGSIIHNSFLAIGIMWQAQTLLPIAALVLVVLLLHRGARAGRWLLPALMAVVLAETTWFGARFHRPCPAETLTELPPVLDRIGAEGRTLVGIDDRPVQANLNILAGLAIADIYYPLRLRRHVELRSHTEKADDPQIAALLGVQWYLARHLPQGLSEGWRLAGERDRDYAYHNAQFRGLAWPVFRAGTEQELRGSLSAPGADREALFEAAFLKDPAAISLPSRGAIGRATLLRQDGRGYAFDCEMGADGLLVITSCWYPGVHATVDGRPAQVLEANIAFCAVPVPAGRHQVELGYAPAGLRTGLLISAISLVLALLGCMLLRRAQLRSA